MTIVPLNIIKHIQKLINEAMKIQDRKSGQITLLSYQIEFSAC